MSWNLLSVLTDEDVKSLVVYLRSLPPIRNPLPPPSPPDEDALADRLALAPAVAPARSDYRHDPVRRGEYLARIGYCVNCHTPFDANRRHMTTLRFGGGVGDAGPAANMTFDPSGISYYDEQLFIQTPRRTVRSAAIAVERDWWGG